MVPTTCVVSLDVGTSSVRTLLYDANAQQINGFGEHISYRVTTTSDGGVEIDADELAEHCLHALTTLHKQVEAAQVRPAAVGFSLFWHSFLGVDAANRPTTPIMHLLDTRSTPQVTELKRILDPETVHRRTGCVLHTSYWPAKLLWLKENRREAWDRTAKWISFGEYLYSMVLERATTSASMVSASGVWNQNAFDYDAEVLDAVGVTPEKLATTADFDAETRRLSPQFSSVLERFSGIPWFPAAGDGACNNVGSGCVEPGSFALMIGTTGAMRAVVETPTVEVPKGLWCYRVDRKRFVLGGALSNGGEVYAWMRRTLQLPDEEKLQAVLAAMEPGAHGLTVLPFFAGERSPYWRADLRAVFSGMSLATQPEDLVRAALESIALRFRQIYAILATAVGEPRQIIASGGGLKSPATVQIMADALGRSLIRSCEEEASSRGAALLALERIGAIGHLRDRPACMGETFEPVPGREAVYERMLTEQQKLIDKLWMTE